MAWKIEWSQDAVRFLSKMEKNDAKRIITKLEEAIENPSHFLSRLAGHEDYKIRVGDWRVIVLLIHSENIVFVEKIGHRKNIYRK